MTIETTQNEYIKNLNSQLNDWGVDFEEERKIKRKKVIHSYLEDFKNLDSESLYPWGDLSAFVESF